VGGFDGAVVLDQHLGGECGLEGAAEDACGLVQDRNERERDDHAAQAVAPCMA
jgi:hypothetical protein